MTRPGGPADAAETPTALLRDAPPACGARLSIAIPCYHQADRAARCLASVLSQSFTDFRVTLLDDGDSGEYRRLVESVGDPRVAYRRNPERLGSLGNIFQAVRLGSEPYSLAFHEDDLLGRDYLSAAVGILERHPRCGFVAAEISEFADEADAALLMRPAELPAWEALETPADFVRAVCRGVEPMFGSVVYRRSALPARPPDVAALGPLCDRPFLLEILSEWSAAVIREPLAFYRRHAAGDGRHAGLRAEHVLALVAAYRQTLPARLQPRDQIAFHAWACDWLVLLHGLIPAGHRPRLLPFLWRARRRGLCEPGALGRAGWRRLAGAVLRDRRRVS